MKNTPYFEIFTDIYNFMKAFYPVNNTDEYWDKALEEADKLARKYQDTQQNAFVRQMIVDILRELERESKR